MTETAGSQPAPQPGPRPVVRPASVTNAIRMLLLISLFSIVATVLVAVLNDTLIQAWAEGNPAASRLLESGGLEAVKKTNLVPSFLPLAIVGTAVFILLVGVLLPFFYEGHGWARVLLASTALFGALLSVLLVLRGVPTTFVVLASIAIVLCLLWFVFLVHPDTTKFIRGPDPDPDNMI